MDVSDAIELINQLIADATSLRNDRYKFDAWRYKCHTVLDRVFGTTSQQARALSNVRFDFTGMRSIGDNGPVIEAFERGIEKSKEVLRTFIWEIQQNGLPRLEQCQKSDKAIDSVLLLCRRFHDIAKQFRIRREGRTPFKVDDEYDVQDLLHALLRLYFDDIRSEEWTPSYAGKSTRMDFLLKMEKLVIEVKKTRKGLDAKRVGEELIIDTAHYRNHPDCDTLVCLVYDPESRIINPAGLESDLSKDETNYSVRVIVTPK